jgi:hypothetical protein
MSSKLFLSIKFSGYFTYALLIISMRTARPPCLTLLDFIALAILGEG